jgi:hypothetical protein
LDFDVSVVIVNRCEQSFTRILPAGSCLSGFHLLE